MAGDGLQMTMFPKPIRREKQRKKLNPLGKVGKRRLANNKARKAADLPWMNICEVAPVLRNWGITFTRCFGDLEWAHARKKRSKHAAVGTPEHEDTVIRACELHHRKYCDELLKADVACRVFMEAIRRRTE